MDETLGFVSRKTPRLNLEHGFIHHIRSEQFKRAGVNAPKFSPSRHHEYRSDAGTLEGPGGNARRGVSVSSPPARVCGVQESVDHDNDEINLSPDFILRLIKAPTMSSSKLNRVGHLLVEKSCEDPVYTPLGASLCAQIVKDVPTANRSATKQFVAVVAQSCRHRLDMAELTRNDSIEKWVALVRFLIECHRSRESLLTDAVEEMLLEVLMNLTQPPCCLNRIEVDALYSAVVYCGQRLKLSSPKHWSDVVARLQDSFINLPAQCVVGTRLLRCIEVIESDWTLH